MIIGKKKKEERKRRVMKLEDVKGTAIIIRQMTNSTHFIFSDLFSNSALVSNL